MGLPARGGPGLGASGAADAVDQFIAREANGYKAEGFSRQKVFILTIRNEESSLPGITSVRKAHNAAPVWGRARAESSCASEA